MSEGKKNCGDTFVRRLKEAAGDDFKTIFMNS